jgi:hypothetical protein
MKNYKNVDFLNHHFEEIVRFIVTQAVWKKVMNGDDPSYFKGDNRPVEKVS